MASFAFHDHAEAGLTAARGYASATQIAAGEWQVLRQKLRLVRRRIDELSKILSALNTRASACLAELEAAPFNAGTDMEGVSQLAQLCMSIVRVSGAPLLTEDGDLNPETERIVIMHSQGGCEA
jgi:hypothetical protein